jgi:hypothetical protein
LTWLRRALAVGAEGQQKRIAGEAFPEMSDASALSELGKYLNGERGESALRIVEAICKLGQRESLRAAFDEHLRDVSLSQLADDVHAVQVQLELFLPTVRKLALRVEEVAEVIPMKGKSS